MKSLNRLLVALLILFAVTLVVPANATNAEESKTFVIVDDITLEIADFNTALESELANVFVKYADFTETLSLDLERSNVVSSDSLAGEVSIKIKSFPRAREYI